MRSGETPFHAMTVRLHPGQLDLLEAIKRREWKERGKRLTLSHIIRVAVEKFAQVPADQQQIYLYADAVESTLNWGNEND